VRYRGFGGKKKDFDLKERIDNGEIYVVQGL
jgi:hypothetical protein